MTSFRRAATYLLLSSFLALLSPSRLFATPGYSHQTGYECSHCHVDAMGGSDLTPAGVKFLDDLKATGRYRPLSPLQHGMRLIVGYVHTLAAILWFGTIMYVHLLLKPAYASKGLPKGELRLGWISMVLVLITGVLLTAARMPSLDAFYATRFGILLSVKIALFLVMFTSAIVVTVYIGPRMRRKLTSPVAAALSADITPDQLSLFDGKEGREAFIAYKGIVYNVSRGKLWKSGMHVSKHAAGNDLTEVLRNAPHGEEKVFAMPQVGMLVATGRKPRKPFHERLFYFFAYMNLVLVFVVIFVISLWRWW